MLEFVLLAVLIILSAFFSGIEVATISLSHLKVKTLRNQNKPGSEILYKLKQQPNKLLIAILIGTNIVNTGAAAIATVVAINLFGNAGVGVATGVMTLVLLVFGEITPKTFALQHAEMISLRFAPALEFLIFIFTPIIFVLEKLASVIQRSSKKRALLSAEELRTIITVGREEGILDKEASEMIHSILDFEETKVGEIMTRVDDVVMFGANITIDEAVSKIIRHPYDRYPVFQGTKDNIIGTIDVADLLKEIYKERDDEGLTSIMKEPIFVNKNDYVDTTLVKFKNLAVPLAIVKDDDNKTVGIITLQDLIEEIVGEIFEKEIIKGRVGLINR
ncbi:MAG: hemolysin family protein [Candidatus Woykebacteria bacterium]